MLSFKQLITAYKSNNTGWSRSSNRLSYISSGILRILLCLLFCCVVVSPALANPERVEAAEIYMLDKVVQWPDGTSEHIQIGTDGYFVLDGAKKRLVGMNLGFGLSYDEEECYWLPENIERMDKILTYLEAAGVRIVEFEPESIWHYGGEAGEEYDRYSTILDLVYEHKMFLMPHFVARHQPDAGDLSNPDFLMGYSDGTDTVGQWASRFADVIATYPNTVIMILGNELNIPFNDYDYQPQNVANYLAFIKNIMKSKVNVPVVANFAAYSEGGVPIRDDIVNAGMTVLDWPCFTHYGDSISLYNSRIEILNNWLDSHAYPSNGYWIEETNFCSWSPPDASKFTVEYLDTLFEHGASMALLHTTMSPGNPGYSFFDENGDPIESMVALTTEFSRLQTPVSVADIPPVVATSNAVNITNSSAELVGIVNDLGSASTVDVSFNWGYTEDNMNNQTAIETVSSIGSFSIGITGLAPETTYHFSLKAEGDGVSYGVIKSFVTTSSVVEEPAGPPVVETKNAINITSSSVTLNGMLTDLNGADTVATAFLIGTNEQRPDIEYTSATLTASGAFTVDISGLLPNTTYYYRSKAVGVETGYGETMSFTTPQDNIAIITQKEAEVIVLDAYGIESTSAILAGNVADMGAASELEVYFLYGNSPECDEGITSKIILTGSGDFGAEIQNLSPATTYYFTVKVADSVISDDVHSFTTAAENSSTVQQLPAVTTLNAKDVKRTSAILTATVLDLGTAPSVDLVFQYGKTSDCELGELGPITLDYTGTYQLKLTGLKSGTSYCFRAKVSGDGVAVGGVNKFITSSDIKHPFTNKTAPKSSSKGR